jgi:AcrR family transcriptional regulator
VTYRVSIDIRCKFVNVAVHETSRKSRPALSRARIIDAAIVLADAGGVRALSMRQIGDHLDVQAMSLYNYVDGKDDLLGALVDRIFDEIQLEVEGGDWRSSLRTTALSAHDLFLEHPWASELVLTPGSVGVSYARLRYINSILERLRAAGFSPQGASHGYHALDSHTLGYTIWELGHRVSPDTPDDFVEKFLEQLDKTTYGFLIEHAQVHFDDPDDGVDDFTFGLDLILEGLAKLL